VQPGGEVDHHRGGAADWRRGSPGGVDQGRSRAREQVLVRNLAAAYSVREYARRECRDRARRQDRSQGPVARAGGARAADGAGRQAGARKGQRRGSFERRQRRRRVMTTYGERAVGLSFNPSGDHDVERIKKLYAEIIDYCNDARGGSSGEKARL